MKYMLDTNICIYLMKNKPKEVLERFKEHEISDVCISAVTYAEMAHGIEKSKYADRNRVAVALFLSGITVMDFDVQAATEYGRVRVELERKGTPIGKFDSMIAAHALSQNLTIVTNNTREFNRVEGLKVENWVA